VHDRRYRQHDDGRQHTLSRAGEDLGHGHQPDRAGRLDPVLDLPGETELLGHGEGDRLHSLEHDRDPDDPGHENGRERGLSGGTLPADALADLREDEQEDKAEQERLDDRAQHELPEMLAQNDEIAQHERAQRGPARGGHGPGGAPPIRRDGASGAADSAISRATPAL
jgi:hypothetical protein